MLLGINELNFTISLKFGTFDDHVKTRLENETIRSDTVKAVSVRVIVAGFCTVAIAYSVRYGYGMLLPEMIGPLSLSKTDAGIIYGCYFFTYTCFTPLLGTLSDLFRYRTILIIFPGLLALGAMLMGTANGLGEAAFYYSIAGLGHAACWVPVISLVQHWVPDNRKGLVLSLVAMGVGLGIPFWGWCLPIVVRLFDWRAGWTALGAAAMAVMVINSVLVRDPDNTQNKNEGGTSTLVQVRQIYMTLAGDLRFWLVGLAYLLIGFNVLVPFTFLPVYAREALGLEFGVSTGLVGIIALFGIGGQLTIGPLSDHLGRIRAMILCGFIMGCGCLAMGMADGARGLQVAAAFFGLGYGAVWPMYGAAASDLFSKGWSGSVIGLWTMLLGIGSILSPILCGWTIDVSGSWFRVFLLGVSSGIGSAAILTLFYERLTRHNPTIGK